MSVVPMVKVRLAVHRSDVDRALDVVQKAGSIEFIPTDDTGEGVVETDFAFAELYPRLQTTVAFLEPYAPKQSLLKTLRQGSFVEVTEDELQKKMANYDVAESLVTDFERLQVEFAETEEAIRELNEKRNFLTAWKMLPIRLADFETEATKTFLLERTNEVDKTVLADDINAVLTEHTIPALVTAVSEQRVALTLTHEAASAATLELLTTATNAEMVTPAAEHETPEVVLVAVEEALAKQEGSLALLHDQAEHFAHTHIKQLRETAEMLSWQQDRHVVTTEATVSQYTVMFDGWLKAPDQATIKQTFADNDIAAAIIELPLAEGEEPPVEIENNALVKPFEAITRLYGMPGHTDLDPTPFLAGFFFLFFGLSLTDVGYGFFLMFASAITLAFFKVAKPIKLFAKLLFFVGLATVLVGAAFGGYFGINPELLPSALVQLQQFDPIGNPLPVFYLALSLGVVQVMVGMLLKIYSEYKNGRLLNGIIVQGPWFFTFAMGVLALLTHLGYVAVLPFEAVKNLAYAGLAGVALSGFYQGEGIFGRIMSAAARLYDSIGYFSDILSYSRLLALGLATTALAFAVNLIAGMVINVPYVGFILAAIILLIGHVFNLAVNTLGAFIHSARLQFVEFFGKFIAGTGREFTPLKRTEEHIVVKSD